MRIRVLTITWLFSLIVAGVACAPVIDDSAAAASAAAAYTPPTVSPESRDLTQAVQLSEIGSEVEVLDLEPLDVVKLERQPVGPHPVDRMKFTNGDPQPVEIVRRHRRTDVHVLRHQRGPVGHGGEPTNEDELVVGLE